jgi:2,4-dienoyl-CoA reductase-like NADH-dependent reductase (Old Yellow Enzyme family)
MSAVFSTLRLRGATLSNRLAVAPMTTTQSHADGTVSEAEAAWLERLAGDGYGMVITCAAAISRSSIAFPRQLSLGDDTFLPGLSALAGRLRHHAAVSVVQLCHGGSRAIPSLTGVPAHSASSYELPIPGFVPPREFSTAQIEQIIEDFPCASERAARAGFGGVEFHGANGYLFTQFLSTMTNRRADDWGGSLPNRARLSRKVVQACRRRVPASFVLGFRMSFENAGLETGLDLDEGAEVMTWLAEDGIDYGHVSHLDFAARSVKDPRRTALELIRARVDRALPLMCAGGITSRAAADRAMELGADLVAVGRSAIGNADVPARLSRGESLRQTPFPASDLAALHVSPDFIRYLQTAVPISTLNIVSR